MLALLVSPTSWESWIGDSVLSAIYVTRCPRSGAEDDVIGIYDLHRIIRESIDAGMVRAVDSTTSKRYMKYVPFWA